MFEELLPITFENPEISYETLVEKTEGYSGSDIRLVCKEAAMQPLRRLMTVLDATHDQVHQEEGMKIHYNNTCQVSTFSINVTDK